jgi:hypothetical protein
MLRPASSTGALSLIQHPERWLMPSHTGSKPFSHVWPLPFLPLLFYQPPYHEDVCPFTSCLVPCAFASYPPLFSPSTHLQPLWTCPRVVLSYLLIQRGSHQPPSVDYPHPTLIFCNHTFFFFALSCLRRLMKRRISVGYINNTTWVIYLETGFWEFHHTYTFPSLVRFAATKILSPLFL